MMEIYWRPAVKERNRIRMARAAYEVAGLVNNPKKGFLRATAWGSWSWWDQGPDASKPETTAALHCNYLASLTLCFGSSQGTVQWWTSVHLMRRLWWLQWGQSWTRRWRRKLLVIACEKGFCLFLERHCFDKMVFSLSMRRCRRMSIDLTLCGRYLHVDFCTVSAGSGELAKRST